MIDEVNSATTIQSHFLNPSKIVKSNQKESMMSKKELSTSIGSKTKSNPFSKKSKMKSSAISNEKKDNTQRPQSPNDSYQKEDAITENEDWEDP